MNIKLILFTITALLLNSILFFSCEQQAVNPHSGNMAPVVVRLLNGPPPEASQLPPNATTLLLKTNNPALAGLARGFCKPGGTSLINSGKVVFFDLGISFEEFEQIESDTSLQKQADLIWKNMTPSTNFQDHIDLRVNYLDFLTSNRSSIEKEGNLEISNEMVRGEFFLTEGLKAATIGLFDSGEMYYLGDSEGLFMASPQDTSYIYIFLEYTGPLNLNLSLPPETPNRVLPIEGQIEATGYIDSERFHISMVVNQEYTQEIRPDFSGIFMSTAILTRRTNTITFTVLDTLTGRTASFQQTVQFTGEFPALRASLSWDGYGDLDLHMMAPDSSECYYLNPNIGGMVLDVDNTSGFGPENISVIAPQTGQYTVSVVNFGQVTGLTATVNIYRWNPNLDREDLIDTQTHFFGDTEPWMVGSYQP
ncbi:MAG: hypothetical protein Kow0037_00040 [Calditrichia bacterium]